MVVQPANSELLIYNLKTDKAFCLNETSTIVFNACNGTTSFAELKKNHQLTDALIYLALDELKRNNLLKGDYISPNKGIDRREVIKRAGLASMMALPIVLSLSAPKAVQANSSTCSYSALIPCNCSVANTTSVVQYCTRFLNGTHNCNSGILNCDCIVNPAPGAGSTTSGFCGDFPPPPVSP